MLNGNNPSQKAADDQAAQQQSGQQQGQQKHAVNAKPSLWQRVKSSVANASYALNAFIITHSDLVMEGNKSSFEYWSKQSNQNIIKSLNPGGKEPMQVHPEVDSDGVVHMRVLNGNMRLNILQSRDAHLGGLNPATLTPVRLEPFVTPNAEPETPEPIDIP
jgi:hypothetical protein